MIRYCRFLAPIVVASIAPVSVALAQQLPAASPAIAFVNVNVISMDGERIDPSQTVVVRGDRIAAMGAVGEVAIPERATIVEATNRYLVPGLTDAHVHLATDMPWAPTRPDFGDAPLYLAHGVTTVINLRGSTAQLDWRRRLEAGELVGPNIYTAGEFVNEPRVNTPEEVRKEIVAQVDDRYDVIKFHAVWVPRQGEVTTTGLSLAGRDGQR